MVNHFVSKVYACSAFHHTTRSSFWKRTERFPLGNLVNVNTTCCGNGILEEALGKFVGEKRDCGDSIGEETENRYVVFCEISCTFTFWEASKYTFWGVCF